MPGKREPLEKLMIPYMVKVHPTCGVTNRPITIFPRAHHRSLLSYLYSAHTTTPLLSIVR
jgi:hypothetical protein